MLHRRSFEAIQVAQLLHKQCLAHQISLKFHSLSAFRQSVSMRPQLPFDNRPCIDCHHQGSVLADQDPCYRRRCVTLFQSLEPGFNCSVPFDQCLKDLICCMSPQRRLGISWCKEYDSVSYCSNNYR
ncbi:hypothetical protein PV05_00205 [Exophiala xenobiotica]|uniref:Uncharacterized protein n=1 Tax=Exophiala xenobiotica TaxID=348802 RepID=A0A0D2DCG7_9EURO|nr:uncharacterized protein PV05_00205 [Exophiala xenobiotica]KIW59947.1 hypothetical protein PV05_00205 [Exophiala xenobiotica]